MSGHVSDCCGGPVSRERRAWWYRRRWWCCYCGDTCRRVLAMGNRP